MRDEESIKEVSFSPPACVRFCVCCFPSFESRALRSLSRESDATFWRPSSCRALCVPRSLSLSRHEEEVEHAPVCVVSRERGFSHHLGTSLLRDTVEGVSPLTQMTKLDAFPSLTCLSWCRSARLESLVTCPTVKVSSPGRVYERRVRETPRARALSNTRRKKEKK